MSRMECCDRYAKGGDDHNSLCPLNLLVDATDLLSNQVRIAAAMICSVLLGAGKSGQLTQHEVESIARMVFAIRREARLYPNADEEHHTDREDLRQKHRSNHVHIHEPYRPKEK